MAEDDTNTNDTNTEIDIPETTALKYAREDASQTLDKVLDKHEGHGKRAIQLVQVNGVVLSLLIAASSQIPFQNIPDILLIISPLLFLFSSAIALFAYRSQTLSFGISSLEVQKYSIIN